MWEKLCTKGTALEAAEKPEFLEGDGLQAVHKCFVVKAALAAEGAIFRQPSIFPQPLLLVGPLRPNKHLGFKP